MSVFSLTYPGACDSHLHVFDAAYRAGSPVPEQAELAHYKQVQQALGTTRAVIVQPRPYGTDNTVTLAAIAALGISNARGIAVLHPDVSDAQLQALHAGGIRGVRFSLYTAAHAAVSFDMVEPLAHRIHSLGWHLQLHWTADQILAHEALLRRLPCPLVFDHMARLPVRSFRQHKAFALVRELLARGRAWVKLSGPYLCSEQSDIANSKARYADVAPLAQAWVAEAAQRLVWGSDWPHTTEPHAPDEKVFLQLLYDWTGDDKLCRQILVDNPAHLYGFAPLPLSPSPSV